MFLNNSDEITDKNSIGKSVGNKKILLPKRLFRQ